MHKKSQENFERITLRRLIQIKDGHPETVSIWLAFLRKYHYYGVGMKANVWEFSGLEVGKDLDAEAERIQERLGDKLELFGRREDLVKDEQALGKMVNDQPFKAAWGAYAAMSAAQSVPSADKRIEPQQVRGESR